MGLIGGILQPFYAGFPVTLVLPVAFLQRPLCWLQTISRTRGTISGGPPFAYDLCVRKITTERRAVVFTRRAQYSSAASPRAIGTDPGKRSVPFKRTWLRWRIVIGRSGSSRQMLKRWPRPSDKQLLNLTSCEFIPCCLSSPVPSPKPPAARFSAMSAVPAFSQEAWMG